MSQIKGAQIIVCILPSDQKERYNRIKKFLIEGEVGAPSQCIQSRNIFSDKAKSIVTKIVHQMTAKTMGAPWRINNPLKNTMYVGIDVHHDKKSGGTSTAAFVASLDDDCTQWFSVALQSEGRDRELINNLESPMSEALRRYFTKSTPRLPENIVIFRDGVGDSQAKAVLLHEVQQFRNVFAKVNQQEQVQKQFKMSWNPKLVVILVQKKIATRFFRPDSSDNPPPGTVVDRDIVMHPKKPMIPEVNTTQYDFYLVSHTDRKGTVAPTRYSVICDESGLPPEYIQNITYKMCHLYYNWTGTIAVPAPCRNAHKFAFLLGESKCFPPRGTPLENCLYYL